MCCFFICCRFVLQCGTNYIRSNLMCYLCLLHLQNVLCGMLILLYIRYLAIFALEPGTWSKYLPNWSKVSKLQFMLPTLLFRFIKNTRILWKFWGCWRWRDVGLAPKICHCVLPASALVIGCMCSIDWLFLHYQFYLLFYLPYNTCFCYFQLFHLLLVDFIVYCHVIYCSVILMHINLMHESFLLHNKRVVANFMFSV